MLLDFPFCLSINTYFEMSRQLLVHTSRSPFLYSRQQRIGASRRYKTPLHSRRSVDRGGHVFSRTRHDFQQRCRLSLDLFSATPTYRTASATWQRSASLDTSSISVFQHARRLRRRNSNGRTHARMH